MNQEQKNNFYAARDALMMMKLQHAEELRLLKDAFSAAKNRQAEELRPLQDAYAAACNPAYKAPSLEIIFLRLGKHSTERLSALVKYLPDQAAALADDIGTSFETLLAFSARYPAKAHSDFYRLEDFSATPAMRKAFK